MKNKIDQTIKGDGNTQQLVEQQINNYGLSPKEALDLSIKLFKENFPVLVEEAQKTVDKRINEIIDDLFERLAKSGVRDLNEFKDPGMQFALVEVMNEYAKYGNQSKISLLNTLLVERISSKEKDVLKFVIDNSLKIVSQLSEENLNYLTQIFFVKHCRFENIIGNVDAVAEHFNNVAASFPVNDHSSLPYVNLLGCLSLRLGDAKSTIVKGFKVDEKELSSKINFDKLNIPGDWGLSYTGIAIAITYIQIKTGKQIDYNIFIR